MASFKMSCFLLFMIVCITIQLLGGLTSGISRQLVVGLVDVLLKNDCPGIGLLPNGEIVCVAQSGTAP